MFFGRILVFFRFIELKKVQDFFLNSENVYVIIIKIINIPPMIVFKEGDSAITSHTHRGPNIVSNTKKISTSYAGIYLGAKVIKESAIHKQAPIAIIK